jgi:hypothetical protein
MKKAVRLAVKASPFAAAAFFAGISTVAACPAPQTLHVDAFERPFHQEKYISGMDTPLRSDGRISARDNKVVWHMQTPFDVKTVITSEGITQSVDGGAASPVASGASEVAASIARSMAAIMQGQWDGLRSMFSVDLSKPLEDKDWHVVLTPLDPRLKSLLGTITVRGCEDVSSVDIARSDGDREYIQFGDAAP